MALKRIGLELQFTVGIKDLSKVLTSYIQCMLRQSWPYFPKSSLDWCKTMCVILYICNPNLIYMGMHSTFLDYMVFSQTWFWMTHTQRHTDQWKYMDVHIQFRLKSISTLINSNKSLPKLWGSRLVPRAKYCKTYRTIHSNWCLGTDSHGMLLEIGYLGSSLLQCRNPHYVQSLPWAIQNRAVVTSVLSSFAGNLPVLVVWL